MVNVPRDITGQILAKKYKLLKLLGAGGMGTVYQAQDLLIDRIIAIKVLRSDGQTDDLIRRFQREAKIAARINHPNCVGLLDFGIDGDRPYLVMPFVAGQTLSSLIAKEGPVLLVDAIPIFLQICDGLVAAHANGVVHRDIKPSNVVLIKEENAYSVKILDFGIAKLREPSSSSEKTMTATGELLGSPRYMSPEQCEGHPADNRSDIYSFGILMYETLTGEPPFRDENIFAIIEKHRSEKPEPLFLTDVDKRIARNLEQIVFRCLEKQPAARYQSALELRTDLLVLNKALAGDSLANLPISKTIQLPKLTWFRKLVLPLVICSLFSFVVLSVWHSNIFSIPPIQARKFPIPNPTSQIALSEAERSDKDRNFSAAIAQAKRIYGENSLDFYKLNMKAGNFFLRAGEYNFAMKYYGPAAVSLKEMNMMNSLEAARLFVKQSYCCIPTNFNLQFQEDRMNEASKIFKTQPVDNDMSLLESIEFGFVQAKLLFLISQRDPSPITRPAIAKQAEAEFGAVLALYSGEFKKRPLKFPQSLVPILSETGDYFYERARTAKDRDAVERCQNRSVIAYKGVLTQCSGNAEFIAEQIAALNDLGLSFLTINDLPDAQINFEGSLHAIETASSNFNNEKIKVLYNLAEVAFKQNNYLQGFDYMWEASRMQNK